MLISLSYSGIKISEIVVDDCEELPTLSDSRSLIAWLRVYCWAGFIGDLVIYLISIYYNMQNFEINNREDLKLQKNKINEIKYDCFWLVFIQFSFKIKESSSTSDLGAEWKLYNFLLSFCSSFHIKKRTKTKTLINMNRPNDQKIIKFLWLSIKSYWESDTFSSIN